MHRMIPMKQEATSSALGSTSNNNNNNPKPSRATSSTWSRLKDPRIVCMSRAFGGKDRHSKVCTVRGIRDRRIRLSVPTAIQLYDLQDRLGLNQPSKVVDWLLNAARHGIDELPPLEIPDGCFARMINSLGKVNPKIVPDNDWQNPKSNQMAEGLYLSREKPCFQIPGLDSPSISRENACFHVVPGLENSVTGEIEKACFQNPGLEKYSATREKACFQDPGMYNFDPSNLILSQIVIPGNPGITGQPDQELQYNLGSLLQLPASIIPSGLSTSHHNQTNCFLPYEMPGTNTEFGPKLSNFPASVVSNSSSLPSLVHYCETLSAVRTAPFSTAEHFSDVKNVLVEQNRINEFHA